MMSEFTSATELAQALRAAEARRIGVDGSDGVGKTPLAQAIAGILRYQLFSLDDYLHKEQGAFVPNIHYDKLASDLAKAQSFVVEGVCLLQVEGDSDRFSDPRGGELRGYTEKMWFPYIDADPPPKARDRIDSIL